MESSFWPPWFYKHVPVWEEYVLPIFRGRVVQALEVGSFEGISACWIAENLLKRDGSSITCIDAWDDCDSALQDRTCAAERVFCLNTQQYVNKFDVRKGKSSEVLPLLRGRKYDLVYIDGEHEAVQSLTDLVLSWPLLKRGGVLVFDDYTWSWPSLFVQPKEAWDSFESCVHDLEVIHRGKQVIARRM